MAEVLARYEIRNSCVVQCLADAESDANDFFRENRWSGALSVAFRFNGQLGVTVILFRFRNKPEG
jgi:hypothetical protein